MLLMGLDEEAASAHEFITLSDRIGLLMQSFLLSETFKYLYLLFAPPETLNFEGVIFTTEAHPVAKN